MLTEKRLKEIIKDVQGQPDDIILISDVYMKKIKRAEYQKGYRAGRKFMNYVYPEFGGKMTKQSKEVNR